EGREEGREVGRIETDRETLRLLLNKRFGLISPSVNERIDTGTGPELKRWIVRILDAPTPEAVFD
ncbi:MAG: hypothetical protein IT168_30490, partial [Bryobacterales bacterium]|nr:hypothetical protein [Bryobacterales bacterium]